VHLIKKDGTSPLVHLVRLCQLVGARTDYVQGGGGNISIKLDEEQMAVKASGVCLKDVEDGKGYCFLNFQKVRNYLTHPAATDDTFSQDVQQFKMGADSSRPSMEAGFHAVLGNTVIHTHSVYVNVFTCSNEGPTQLRTIWPNAFFLDYLNPGRELTLAIRGLVTKEPTGDKIFFLANHGLIISADSPKRAWEIHEDINLKLMEMLNVTTPFNVDYEGVVEDLKDKELLFPDQLIYHHSSVNEKAYFETLAAWNFISRAMRMKGFSLRKISAQHADSLENMESEKYRKTQRT